MILAAAAYADDPKHHAPPPALTLYWRTQTYGALPRAGGLDDQPAGLLDRMSAAANVYRAWRGLVQATSKVDWQAAHPDEWGVCQTVMKLRRAHGQHD